MNINQAVIRLGFYPAVGHMAAIFNILNFVQKNSLFPTVFWGVSTLLFIEVWIENWGNWVVFCGFNFQPVNKFTFLKSCSCRVILNSDHNNLYAGSFWPQSFVYRVILTTIICMQGPSDRNHLYAGSLWSPSFVCMSFWAEHNYLYAGSFWSQSFVCRVIMITIICMQGHSEYNHLYARSFWAQSFLCRVILSTIIIMQGIPDHSDIVFAL